MQQFIISGRPVKVSKEISDRYFEIQNEQTVSDVKSMEIEPVPPFIFHCGDNPYFTKYLVKNHGLPLCFLAQKDNCNDFTIGYVEGKNLSKKVCREIQNSLKQVPW